MSFSKQSDASHIGYMDEKGNIVKSIRQYECTPESKKKDKQRRYQEKIQELNQSISKAKRTGIPPSKQKEQSPSKATFRYIPPTEKKLLKENIKLSDMVDQLHETVSKKDQENEYLKHKVKILEEEVAHKDKRIEELEMAIQKCVILRTPQRELVLQHTTNDGSPSILNSPSEEDDVLKSLISKTLQEQHANGIVQTPEKHEPGVGQSTTSALSSPLDIVNQNINSRQVTKIIKEANQLLWNTKDGFPSIVKYHDEMLNMVKRFRQNEDFASTTLLHMNLMRKNHLQYKIFETYRQYIESGESVYPTNYQRPVIWYPYYRNLPKKSSMGWIARYSPTSDDRVHAKTTYFNYPDRHLDILYESLKSYNERYQPGDRQFIEENEPALFYVMNVDYTLESAQPELIPLKWVGYAYNAYHKIKDTHKSILYTRVKNVLSHFYNCASLNTFLPHEGGQLIDYIMALNWLRDPETFHKRSHVFAIHRYPLGKHSTVQDMQKRIREFIKHMQLKLPFVGANQKIS